MIEVRGELPPDQLPSRDLVLLREGGEAWSVMMRCPCGCGRPVELPLIREARPRWSLQLDGDGHPSLVPSVWRRDGCRAHYFVRRGKVVWI
ncbi:DUF6527 family protein [Acidovorax sp. KKS102]|uniref:DUF6527 family protein n=1 Tax=Acidovorax sp. KKS102 TaxID=358220 RepID=UPI0011D297FB